jgi:hypothetical protein
MTTIQITNKSMALEGDASDPEDLRLRVGQGCTCGGLFPVVAWRKLDEMRGQADERPGKLDEEASTSSGSTASDTDSEGGGDNGEEEGGTTATLILALVQAASLMGCALESPHAFAGLSSARNTPITPPEEMIMAIGIFCFAVRRT